MMRGSSWEKLVGGYLVLWALGPYLVLWDYGTQHIATAIRYGSWESYATDVNGIC